MGYAFSLEIADQMGMWSVLLGQRADNSYPASYLKGCLTAVGQSGPCSTPLRIRAAALDHTLITFQVISTRSPDSVQVWCPLWLSLCGTEDPSQSTGCLLKAQSDMSITGSGRTLRIRSMAGTPIIQLCNRLFGSVSPAVMLFMLTCGVFLHLLLIVLLSIAVGRGL